MISRKLWLGLCLLVLSGNNYAFDQACGAYPCLFTGFTSPGCQRVKPAMLERIWEFKSPIPSWGSCQIPESQRNGYVNPNNYRADYQKISLIYPKKWDQMKDKWIDEPKLQDYVQGQWIDVTPTIIEDKWCEDLKRSDLEEDQDNAIPERMCIADMVGMTGYNNGVKATHQYIQNSDNNPYRYDRRDYYKIFATDEIVLEIPVSQRILEAPSAPSSPVEYEFKEYVAPAQEIGTPQEPEPPAITTIASSHASTALGQTISTVDNISMTRVSPDYQIHGYSKRPSITIDNQYVLLGNVVRRISDGSLVATFPAMNGESVVSLSDPDIVWGIAGGNVIKSSISKGTSEVHMSAHGATLMGQWEGGVSADDRYMVADNGQNLMVLDLKSGGVAGKYTASGAVNGLAVSNDGGYVAWVEGGTLMKANSDFSNIVNTGLDSSHSDFATDVNGDPVYVHYSGSDYFSIVNMRTNQITKRSLGENKGNGHVSGHNVDRPGWAYFTHYNGKLEAIKLDYSDTLTIENWGTGYDKLVDYDNFVYEDTGKATVSADGRSILITSTFQGTRPRADYLVRYDG